MSRKATLATHVLVAPGAVGGEDAHMPLHIASTDDEMSPAREEGVKNLLWLAYLKLEEFVAAERARPPGRA